MTSIGLLTSIAIAKVSARPHIPGCKMRIVDNNTAAGVGPAGPLQSPAKAARPAAAPAQLPRRADSLTVLGIPESELSPAVRAALQTLMAEVDRMRRELDQSRQRIDHLERLADEDTLLPLANRRAFVRELSRMMSFAERYGSTGGVVYFDVNHLKRVNDAHGHAAGDAALRRITEILRAKVRESDLIGRLGGDEFGVALAQLEPSAVVEKAQMLAAAIDAAPFEWNGAKIALSVAWGAYPFKGSELADDALEAADRAMYDRKREEVAR